MSEESTQQVLTPEEAYAQIYTFWRENFPTPAHVIAFYDEELRDEKYSLFKWQAMLHNDILSKEYTSEAPLELALQAVNGSGKDKLIIAPFEAWFMMRERSGTIVVTSSSGTQLTTQTEKYIRILCQKINRYHRMELFDIKQRNVKCVVTGAELFMFATDEAGKAEGYHPVAANAKLAIITNEAKSIKEEIFEALTRCTGFTHWIEVSSAGKADGHFYRLCTSGRKSVHYVKVISDDCPNLGGELHKERVLAMCSGNKNHYVYRSMVNCEFGSDGEDSVVLTFDKYNRCVQFKPEWLPEVKNTAGLDLSGGGDEQVLTIRNGNKIIKILAWNIKDAVLLVDTLCKAFERYNLKGCIINADAGNMGKTIIDLLHNRGWKNVRYIFNQSSPNDALAYYNIGAEMWFNMASLIENQDIDISIEDEIFKKQVCNRYYKLTNRNATTVYQLESKPQAKAKGHPSPDRADSVALCFLNYKTPLQIKSKAERIKHLEEQQELNRTAKIPTNRGFVEAVIKYGNRNNSLSNSGMITAQGGYHTNPNIKSELRLELKQLMETLHQNN